MKYSTRLAVCFFSLCSSVFCAEEGRLYDINMKFELQAFEGEELLQFSQSLPQNDSQTYEEWKESFIYSMIHLIYLVERDQICQASWTASINGPELE